MTRTFVTAANADRFMNAEPLVRQESYVHPVMGHTLGIPADGMNALIVEGSHIEISIFLRPEAGPTLAITQGMAATHARALGAQLLAMADELDDGKGKQ